ncbi:hypothetical protein [Marivita geojedonensis]|uniref:Uncharacterized protein n=1 Tax=Marivita geojedonensis TaxID=1123756 RepID=A0A1X4N8Z2_9RHOB|nr:hypothetical protein [Marivita geojedonensis]OSQ42689.1 hypothetical protein MGEO_20355 [Marivita geojedonensis]PRY71611.1 hypothetical protein CLV76_1413 [Marivita geojedonensis]
MLTTFTLLLAAGVGCRLALSLALSRYSNRSLEIPQALAVILIVLACLPSWASPLALPVPLAFVLGAVLPDLLTRRT